MTNNELDPRLNDLVSRINARSVYTADMDRPKWLQMRRGGIGGSDAPAIARVSRYATPLDVYLSKVSGADIPDSDIMWFGREIEPAIARRFAQETGLEVVHPVGHAFVDTEYSCLIANPDGFIIEDGELGILEMKSTSKWAYDAYDTDLDPAWVVQAYHYMGITGARFAYIAFTVDRSFHFRKITRTVEVDRAITQLRQLCINFWDDYVVPQVAPPVANIEDAARLWPVAETGKVIAASDTVYQKVIELADIKAKMKALTAAEKELKEFLAIYMEDAELLTHNGIPVATYRTINKKEFTVKASSYRQMNLKIKGEL